MAFLRFEDLRVFKLAEELCDEIWTLPHPGNILKRILIGMQLVKAADSIGANIAEGSGRGTPRDNKRFKRISRGSLDETKYWLRRARRRNLIGNAQAASFLQKIEDLAPQLNAYLKSIGQSAKH